MIIIYRYARTPDPSPWTPPARPLLRLRLRRPLLVQHHHHHEPRRHGRRRSRRGAACTRPCTRRRTTRLRRCRRTGGDQGGGSDKRRGVGWDAARRADGKRKPGGGKMPGKPRPGTRIGWASGIPSARRRRPTPTPPPPLRPVAPNPRCRRQTTPSLVCGTGKKRAPRVESPAPSLLASPPPLHGPPGRNGAGHGGLTDAEATDGRTG